MPTDKTWAKQKMSDRLHTASDDRKRLVALITQHQRRVFSYIYTLVPRRQDAEDLFQETLVVICEKFDDFTEGTDFVAWACQIAYWRVRYARQKFARSKVFFNQEVLDVVASSAGEMTSELDDRHVALAHCLEKLHPRDREFILTRYEPGGGVEAAAQKSGRSITTAYKALSRIRKLLSDCVSEHLVSGAAS